MIIRSHFCWFSLLISLLTGKFARAWSFQHSAQRHFNPVFRINSMIPVGWTIYRDRFWDHLVIFGCILSKLDRQRGLIRLTVRFKTMRWIPRCQNSPPMSLDAKTALIAIKETFLKSSDTWLERIRSTGFWCLSRFVRQYRWIKWLEGSPAEPWKENWP